MSKKKTAPRNERSSAASTNQLQKQIDKYDREILRLTNDRARAIQRSSKGQSGPPDAAAAGAADQVRIQQLLTANKGPLTDQPLRSIFREISSASRALVKVTRVVY